MGTFRQISTDLWPFIEEENWFQCSISLFFGGLSSNFVYKLIFKRNGLGLYMGKFCQISTDLLPLIYVKICFHALSWTFLADCLPTSYTH